MSTVVVLIVECVDQMSVQYWICADFSNINYTRLIYECCFYMLVVLSLPTLLGMENVA